MLSILSGLRSFLFLGLLTLVLSSQGHSAELAGDLSVSEVKAAGRILGFGSHHRSWTAHALPTVGLGLDLGLESTFVFRRELATQGDGNALAPRVIPVPRLWLAWDLPSNFMVSSSLAPGFIFDGVTAFGVAGQYTYARLPEISTHLSAVLSYSFTSAFGDLRSNQFEAAAQVSRDLVLWQPYAGLGLMWGQVNANAARLGAGVNDESYTTTAVHFYAGARVDLVAKLAVQLDFFNTKPAFSVLLANSF